MNSSERSAYLAGIVDGEGSIYCCRSGGYYYPILEIGQSGDKGKDFLFWIRSVYGGHINSYKPGKKTRNRLQAHAWILTGKSIVPALEDVLPFLRLKRAQALKAIEMTKLLKQNGNGRAFKISEENLAERKRIGEEISQLNKSGNIPANIEIPVYEVSPRT